MKMIFRCSLMTFCQPTTNCYYLLPGDFQDSLGKPPELPDFQLHVPSSPFHQGAALRLPGYKMHKS